MDSLQDEGPTRQTELIVDALGIAGVVVGAALIAVIVAFFTPLPWWAVWVVLIAIAAIIRVVKYPMHRPRTPRVVEQTAEPPSQPPAAEPDDTQELPIHPAGVVGTQTYDHNPRLAPCEVFTDSDGMEHYAVRQTSVTTDGWIPGKRAKTWHVTTRSVVLDKSPLVDSRLVLRSSLNPIGSETRIYYLQRFDWWQWGKRPIGIVVSMAVLSIILAVELGGPLSVYLSANCLGWLVALGFCFAAWITWGHIVLVLTDQRLLLLHNPPFPFIQDQTTDKLLRLISTFDKRSSRLAKTFFNDRFGTIKAGTAEQAEEDGWMHGLKYVRHYAELQLLVTEIMNDPGATPEGRLLQSIKDSLTQERPEPRP